MFVLGGVSKSYKMMGNICGVIIVVAMVVVQVKRVVLAVAATVSHGIVVWEVEATHHAG